MYDIYIYICILYLYIYIIKIIYYIYIYNKQIFYINIRKWLGENVSESSNQTLPLS